METTTNNKKADYILVAGRIGLSIGLLFTVIATFGAKTATDAIQGSLYIIFGGIMTVSGSIFYIGGKIMDELKK